MQVVIAPDSFKGTLDAAAVATAIRAGWRRIRPADQVTTLPLADGGEGTVAAFAGSPHLRAIHRVGVADGSREVEWVELDDGRGVVELASACGLTTVSRLDPLGAHTGPLGEVLAAAVAAGVCGLLVGLGGSASTDGGVGALAAVGARFVDSAALPVPRGGRGLHRLAALDTHRLVHPPQGGVTLLVDVENPLLGPRGAAAVFAPQKGASAQDVAVLDAGLARLHHVLGHPDGPGLGAAGGTAYGLVAVWGAVVTSGAAAVLHALEAPAAIRAADLVITGEGRFDETSLGGKLVGTVLAECARAATAAVVIAGSLDIAPPDSSPPVTGLALSDLAGSSDEARRHPADWLAEAGAALAVRYPVT